MLSLPRLFTKYSLAIRWPQSPPAPPPKPVVSHNDWS